MLRILIAAWSFPGHINPTVALGRALRERGHDVAFSTGERARSTIERQGFSYFPFQHVDEERVYEAVFSSRSRSLFSRMQVFRDWLLTTVPNQVSDLEAILSAWKPDVIVSDVTVWGPPLVLHERFGMPVAICSFAPGCMIPSREAPPWGFGLPSPRTRWARWLCRIADLATDLSTAGFRRVANQIRNQFGLPALHVPIHQYLGQMPLYLVPSVSELDYNRRDVPSSVHYIGPLIWNETKTAGTPEWLEKLSRERPWVHVSEGTMHAWKPFLLEAAARGLANLPMEIIMTTGGSRDPEALGLKVLAPNIRVERWVPHAELFSRTDVVVTTGGAGTILTALNAAIPLVIVPTEWDKMDNAQRVVEAGAAIRISPRRCSPGRLRKAVEQVLSDVSYRNNARRLADILKRCNGPARAAELIEETFHR